MSTLSIGSIVRCRNRDWVIVPSADDNLLMLRPLTGSENEVCGIHRAFARLGIERVETAAFPLPSPEDASDAVSAELLFNAARLSLRDGAGPFRSLGRISVQPRPYQFVPLLMALRLLPIRLLIADDVGVGKTIEAILIARELLDRGEITRLCVLCPPYLCEQWQKELSEKFHIQAEIIRSGTVGKLERNLPPGDHSIFRYYPYIIVSIDYAKSHAHRENFLTNCPECVIVDEAHGAAKPSAHSAGQQQRHELLTRVAKNTDRHLILLTATPHSGVEESFVSLLALLDKKFAAINLNSLTKNTLDELVRHFIQRRRADVKHWLGSDTPFPERDSEEITYELSKHYRELFQRVLDFSKELVHEGEKLSGWKRRIRYWTALALLRCVMSSPAAALSALLKREKKESVDEEDITDEAYSPYIYESSDEKETVDVPPAHIVQEAEMHLSQTEQRRLREFAKLAEKIKGTDEDTKITECVSIVKKLLQEGFSPIVWCRYIATSEYVAEELQRRLQKPFKDIRVVSVTGMLSDDERMEKINELAEFQRKALVATDCLSEGVNLQEHFNAVVHYDLPWNPNRLEQREGRVDRFGQKKDRVKVVLLYGRDNAVDGAVLDVLLRKAKTIYRSLGISVPVPINSETVMEAVLKALYFRGTQGQQMTLFEEAIVKDLHNQWDRTAEREKESRTRFAQRSIQPEDVERELKETDAVLGDNDAVKRFVENACQRFGVTLRAGQNGIFTLSALDRFPDMIQSAVPKQTDWKVSFTAFPPPEKVTYLGRNHTFVAQLAQYLLEEALEKGRDARAARCGAIRTKAVDRRTVILLLRLRFALKTETEKPLLAEQVLVAGFKGMSSQKIEWLGEDSALELLQNAKPDANMSPNERAETLEEALSFWEKLKPDLETLMKEQSKKLEDAHRRVRSAAHLSRKSISVSPYFPPDLLGILALLPVPGGVK